MDGTRRFGWMYYHSNHTTVIKHDAHGHLSAASIRPFISQSINLLTPTTPAIGPSGFSFCTSINSLRKIPGYKLCKVTPTSSSSSSIGGFKYLIPFSPSLEMLSVLFILVLDSKVYGGLGITDRRDYETTINTFVNR